MSQDVRVKFGGAALALFVMAWPWPSVAARIDAVEPAATLTWLREHRFAELDSLLNSHQRRYEADVSHEDALAAAFRLFYTSAGDIEKPLDEWIARHPSSYAAYVARGIYRSYRAWDARGGKYIDETPEENIQAMEKWFDLALPDLEHSLQLTSTPLLSYVELIGIGQARGWTKRKRQWLNEANRVAPTSVGARLAYIASLRPQWGGSLVEMIAFAEESSEHLSPPQQRRLESYIWRAKGRKARQQGDWRTAAQHYTKSLELDEADGEMYVYRGLMYAELGQWPDALRDYNRAVELRPKDAHAFRRRGALLLKMNELDRALADYDRALALKPNDGWVLGNRGYIHERRGRLAQALSDYQQAAQAGNAWAQNRLGEMYWHGHGTTRNPQEAVRWWNSASEKGNPQAREHLRTKDLTKH